MYEYIFINTVLNAYEKQMISAYLLHKIVKWKIYFTVIKFIIK